jgi:hypothetical protein
MDLCSTFSLYVVLGLGSLLWYSDGFTVPEVFFRYSGGVSKSNCSVYRGQMYSILIDGVMISVKNEGAHSYNLTTFSTHSMVLQHK